MGMCRTESKGKLGHLFKTIILEESNIFTYPFSINFYLFFRTSALHWVNTLVGGKMRHLEPHFVYSLFPKISGKSNLKDRYECFGEPCWSFLCVWIRQSISKNSGYSSIRYFCLLNMRIKYNILLSRQNIWGFISDYSDKSFWSLKPPNCFRFQI